MYARESRAPHFFMKILFRKILDYDLKKDKPDAFIYSCKILSQKVDPDSLKQSKFIPKSNVVFCSKLKRARQCVKKTKNSKIIFTESLNEIPFDLKFYTNELEYNKYGSLVVRKIFKKLFIEDKLIIKRDKIFSQVKKLLENIKSNYSNEKSVMIVSHSFRLKCIEAYLKTNGKIIKSPKLIEKYIKNSQKTFDFGKGFDFEI